MKRLVNIFDVMRNMPADKDGLPKNEMKNNNATHLNW